MPLLFAAMNKVALRSRHFYHPKLTKVFLGNANVIRELRIRSPSPSSSTAVKTAGLMGITIVLNLTDRISRKLIGSLNKAFLQILEIHNGVNMVKIILKKK